MKFGIVVFPGSNCDHDCYHVVKNVCKQEAVFLWHKEHDLKNCDCIILPGGFSYGDYLRSGAIAGKSPIINEVVAFANKGGYILGICNGFQVLTETHLLPGVLMRNRDLSFICKNVDLTIENNRTPFTMKYQKSEVITVPIAHMDGCYFAEDEAIKALEDNGQIVFKYSGENPNGALKDIAGICSKDGRVLGMMPHPERCSEKELGGTDGIVMFESIIQSFGK